ncbi:Transcription factor-like 5 protein [Saguinus oedipus]|uniref:Transcription factor-like 5 protein n=1 Tax=Saguinus oedipus TaxID=9490 RepID=A0ABQ9VN67_SAGOE|nr:Transcription factor-like 5 protein [Saguinus oedipus]
MRQLDTNVERRALGEIQNVGEGAAAMQGAWQSSESSQSNLGEQAQSGPQGGRSQRRERHNRMERDRRRRIRICCDELNLLVPFCNAETDKATTLQWTTAFLKYIQERHGDSLKKQVTRLGWDRTCGLNAGVPSAPQWSKRKKVSVTGLVLDPALGGPEFQVPVSVLQWPG